MMVPENADRDFTASAFIVENNRILLLKHSKTGFWLQPGGHIEDRETPGEAARREAREETGFEVELVESNEKIGETFDLPQPFNVNLHPIEDNHHHLDFAYLAKIGSRFEATHSHEHDGLEWFSAEEVADLADIPENVRQTALKAIEQLEH